MSIVSSSFAKRIARAGLISAATALFLSVSTAYADDKLEAASPDLNKVKSGCAQALGDFFKSNERYAQFRGKADTMCGCIVERTAKNETLSDKDRSALYKMYATVPGSPVAKQARGAVPLPAQKVSRGIVGGCRKEALKPS